MASKIDVGACVSYGFESLKKNLGFHVVAIVIFVVLNGMSAGVLAGPILLGYFKALEKADSGQAPEIGDLFSRFDKFVPAFLVSLFCGILTAIGYFIFIVPGLLIAPLLPAALTIVDRGENDGIEAVKKAWACLQPNILMAAVAILVLGIIGSIGALACGFGMIFTAPIAIAGMYKLGQQMVAA